MIVDFPTPLGPDITHILFLALEKSNSISLRPSPLYNPMYPTNFTYKNLI